MSEKKKFSSLAEAMAALPEKTRKHSERVADYMRVLFVEACFADDLLREPKSETRLRDELTETAYDIGYYHDVGKVFVPAELHLPADDYSSEEKTLYRRHVEYSSRLIFDMYRAEKNCNARAEALISEAIESSHEYWDGSGFPQGIAKKNISVLSRLLTVADALDNLSSTTRVEKPFELAIEYINEKSGVLFDPRVVTIVNERKAELKAIFNRIEADTAAVPRIEPIVPASGRRIVRMNYRPLVDRSTNRTAGCEALPSYRLGQNWVGNDRITEVLADTKEEKLGELRRGLLSYLVADACDMLRHCDAAEIKLENTLLNLPVAMLRQRMAASDILSVIKDEEIDPSRVRIAVEGKQFLSAAVILKKNVETLRAAGVKTVIYGVQLGDEEVENPKDAARITLTPAQAAATGASVFRLDAAHTADMDDKLAVERYATLKNAGVEFISDSIEDKKAEAALNLLCVNRISGDIRGTYADESAFIAAEIAAQNAE